VSAAFFRTLARDAASRYRAHDRFARHFAFGKLTRDPAFRYLLQNGLIRDGARLLDLGCGQGLLTALLLAAGDRHAQRSWPEAWAAPPSPGEMRGVDLMQRDVERARSAAGPAATFVCGDIRTADIGAVDTVVILDVLHYIDFAAQEDVLRRIRAAFGNGGVLLLRVGDQSSSLRFRFTDAVDRAVMALRGHRLERLYTKPLAVWKKQLAEMGFCVEAIPMSAGTPFANVLLVARYHAPS
jgi:SAM-dependent methyltransferase